MAYLLDRKPMPALLDGKMRGAETAATGDWNL